MPILMQGGLGLSDAIDGFFQARDAERKRRLEEEAPAALSGLLDAVAQRNAASPSPVFAPQAAPSAARSVSSDGSMSSDGSVASAPAPTPRAAAPIPRAATFAAIEGNEPTGRGGIKALIANAAQRHGVDPDALIGVAGIESRFNPNAKNPNSSAGGLFQFVDGTARQYGLRNKFDPNASADAGARLMADNTEVLYSVLGRKPTKGELYLAHQQGAGGAAKLLAHPNALATDLVGADAVRLNGGHAGMKAGEFASLWTSKLDGQGGAQVAAGEPTRVPTLDEMRARKPDTAQVASNDLTRVAPLPPPRPANLDTARGQVASNDETILPPPSPAMQRVQDEAKAKGIGQTSPEPTPAQALMTQAATRGATAPPAPSAPSAPPAPAFTGFAGVNAGGSLSMTPQLKAAALAAYKNPNTRPVAASIIGEILKGKQSEFSLENVNGHAVLFRKHDGAMFPLSGLEKAPEPYTLGENQSRFDGANRLVARGADKAEKDPEKSRILNDALANWQRYHLPDPNDPANAMYWQDYSAKVLGGGEVQKAPTSVEEHNHYVAEEKAAGRVPKSYEQWDLSRRRSQNQAEFGTIPAGHRLVRNEDGSVSMQPIPGSPAEREQKEAAEKAAQTKQQAAVSGGIVVQDIDRVLKLANDPNNLPISGGAGDLLSRIPYTAAHDAAALLETVKANATFDRLQQMRNASPTGGALGNVSDFENRRLAATIGNLEQSQSKEQFVENLKRVKNTYLDIVHGEGKGPPREAAVPGAPGELGPLPSPDKRIPLPQGYTAARAVAEAKREYPLRDDAGKAMMRQRLHSYGIDPAVLGK